MVIGSLKLVHILIWKDNFMGIRSQNTGLHCLTFYYISYLFVFLMFFFFSYFLFEG